MTDSEKIRTYLAEMAKHEAAIARIKCDLASILLGESVANGTETAPKEKAKARTARNDHSTVARGTKGRRVLDIIDNLGGQARAGKVAEKLGGGPTKKIIKRVRTYIYHLSRAETGYLEKGDEPGVWKLTLKAYEAMGKSPPDATEERQEGGAELDTKSRSGQITLAANS